MGTEGLSSDFRAVRPHNGPEDREQASRGRTRARVRGGRVRVCVRQGIAPSPRAARRVGAAPPPAAEKTRRADPRGVEGSGAPALRMLGASRQVCGVPLRAVVRPPSPLMAEPGTPRGSVLKDVVAYVEVWSANGTENYSKTFTNQLVEMGAKVSKTFNKQVTHVVFKDGYQRTWDKAQERGVKLVSVLWVEKCRTEGAHADEALFPAARPPEHLPCLVRKKHKCMQPKDFTPKTPENDKRLQKKFEKMANELQRQKTTLGDDVPVLLFESSGSLVYSPTTAVHRGHHLAMEKRLQEMKEKRENLSLTSSQLMEEPCDDSSWEASLDISRDTALCSDDSLAGGLQSSFDELCGGSGCGQQDRSRGGRTMETRSAHPSASPQHCSRSTPRKPTRPVPEEEGGGWRGAAGGAVAPHAGPSAQVVKMRGEKRSLSPVPPAPKGCRVGRPGPGGSSEKRGRPSEHRESPREGSLERRQCGREPPAPRVRLFQAEKRQQLTAWPAVEPWDYAASSYEDYFSPENLRERSSETLPPGQRSPSSPARFACAAGLSKRQRTSVLEMADFSCLGRSLTSPDLAGSTAKRSARLGEPASVQPDTALGRVAPETPPAAKGTSGCHQQGEVRTEEGTGPEGSGCPCTDPELTHPPAHPGGATPTEGNDSEVKDSVGVFPGLQEEDPTSRAPSASEGVEDGPARHGDLEGSRAGRKDRSGPHEASQRRGKGQKPTRTLVMTSLPSEEQSIVVQVVAKLKGFSVAREVCGSTTHVLAGQALRTLNVLLGLARGCWILSYEWALWSLELGHWISEEPFELSASFPAAPIRSLSTGSAPVRTTCCSDRGVLPHTAPAGGRTVSPGGPLTQTVRQGPPRKGPFCGQCPGCLVRRGLRTQNPLRVTLR
ncbi:microcephalin isoform X3 [Artibeus jamaicensis]|uniref:microcephalin isoform X3 n=1 Tax=Artibeus jamaicensis TaxID=9417 RepID=UPI00235A66A9|nr:microcephalin isoform X3 [Artibeus jamaicensis]